MTPENFSSLDLSDPILKAIEEKGYKTLTPIQAQSIPPIIMGQDIMAAAQTGTGKTAGFTLPLLERLSKKRPPQSKHIHALILTPTRELAAQVMESVTTYGKYTSIKSIAVFGGVKANRQINRLKEGIDVLVATPGRLLDLYDQKALKFTELEVIVLDEADRMLDMGFIHDIRKILGYLPKNRQTLMFSATFSTAIRSLAKNFLINPIEISVTPRNATTPTVDQWLYSVDKNQKNEFLTHLILSNNWHQVLVFCRTKHGADRLAKFLNKKKISCAAIHGNKTQNARTKALSNFKEQKIQILVATDIAARGLDIEQLPQVVNFDLPDVPEDYVHRIGRTGRASATGQAISLVSYEEFKQLSDLERLTKKIITRKTIPGFEPTKELPVSDLNKRIHKPKYQDRKTSFSKKNWSKKRKR